MNRTVNQNEGPDVRERESISQELSFLASVLGENPALTDNEACGLMALLYRLADKVFPEGKEAPHA